MLLLCSKSSDGTEGNVDVEGSRILVGKVVNVVKAIVGTRVGVWVVRGVRVGGGIVNPAGITMMVTTATNCPAAGRGARSFLMVVIDDGSILEEGKVITKSGWFTYALAKCGLGDAYLAEILNALNSGVKCHNRK